MTMTGTFKPFARGIAEATVLMLVSACSHAAKPIAPTGTLRVVYLAGNPVQATEDPVTKQVSGVAIDIAREFGRRHAVPVSIRAIAGIQPVIDAVRNGEADIGFLANDPSRRGPIQFSQTYLRNPQSLIVPGDSPIQKFDDIDKAGLRIGGTRADSITLYLARNLKSATLVELASGTADAVKAAFAEGKIGTFGANRKRLSEMATDLPRHRILPGSIYGVPQAIIVANDRPETLAAVEAFLNQARANGFLADAVQRAGNGTKMEPAPVR